MMAEINGQMSVPPGFRFHPTEEELVYYYLRRKVSYEAIDLDHVIREIDLNKLEPWDLKDKCRIGTGLQNNEWYFFSHKDKKYPTGTRTNRATVAGFWKATGRDKAIHLSNSERNIIGMRKTLVFYTGRAPHGQKTDWIMHEYRLDETSDQIQEDGWVVCRAFRKKNHTTRVFEPEIFDKELLTNTKKTNINQTAYAYSTFDHAGSMQQLPQLFSQESAMVPCSRNLLRLTNNSSGCGAGGAGTVHPTRGVFNNDFSILDKLLAASSSRQCQLQNCMQSEYINRNSSSVDQHLHLGTSASSSTQNPLPFQYISCSDMDLLKFSN